MSWYQITNKRLIIILIISVLWIVAGWILYVFVGADHGPEGGLDSIANAIVYVFAWKLLIYVPPALLTTAAFFLWLWQNHRKAFIWVVIAIAAVLLLVLIFNKYIRKIINTPERVAAHTDTFEEWDRKRLKDDTEKRTEEDLVCDYIEDLVSDTITEFHSLHPEDDIAGKTAYIDAALEAHYRELPHVEGWEYIADVRDIIPARSDGDDEFLLDNSDLCAVADHYHRTLNRSHWYDRYQYERMVIAEWYSWLPMLAVFYDDGSMDIIIAT